MKRIICIIFTLTLASHAHGILLDWAQVNWTPGASSQVFTNVDGSGIDVSISVTLAGGSYNTTPRDNDQYLILFPDWSTNNRTQSYIDVTIGFSRSVTGVSFSFGDIDRGVRTGGGWWTSYYAWEDIIEQVSGTLDGNTVAGTVTNIGSNIQVDTTSVPGQTLYRGTGDDTWTPDGSMTLGWNQEVDTVSFRYSSGSLAQSNPVGQVIGVSNIRFHSPVPEPGTILAGGLIAVLLASRRLIRRKNQPE